MSSFALITYAATAIIMVASLIFTVWVFIGGWIDQMDLFRDLKAEVVGPKNGGRVE